MNTQRKYKFGIIGCGVIAPKHADSIIATGRGEIQALCDIKPEKAESMAAKYGVKQIYSDYKKLIDDPQVEIVCVCTPSGVHGEEVTYACQAGKHIFCEKPVEITRPKLDAIVEAVEKSGVKMGCVFQRRTREVYVKAREAIQSGRFGKIILADAYLKMYRSQAYYDSAEWRGTWELDGGGALMNQGVHGIDMLQWVAGDVESVFARCGAKARNIPVEDTAAASLKFSNGAFGIIEGTTSVYPAQRNRFEIHMEKGSIIFGDKGIIEWKSETDPDEKAPDIQVNDTSSTKDDPTKIPKNSHLDLVKDIIDAIDQNREPMIPPREARKAVDLILAIYESSRTGKEVTL